MFVCVGTNLPVQSQPSEDAWEDWKRDESAIKVTKKVAIALILLLFSRREKDVDEHFSRRGHKVLQFSDIAQIESTFDSLIISQFYSFCFFLLLLSEMMIRNDKLQFHHRGNPLTHTKHAQSRINPEERETRTSDLKGVKNPTDR